MNLTDRAMSNETENLNPAPPANNNTQDAAADMPQTPEQVMQAASARIAELEAELAGVKDPWVRAQAETAQVSARAPRGGGGTAPDAGEKIAPGGGAAA